MELLSESQREALRQRAAGLRAELGSQVARRDDAVAQASRAREDAALIGQVLELEGQVESAKAQADAAEGTVQDAMEAMLAAAARQGEVINKTDPTGESPATPATDNTTPDGLQGPQEVAPSEVQAPATVTPAPNPEQPSEQLSPQLDGEAPKEGSK